MITYVSKKSGMRYPESGVASWFTPAFGNKKGWEHHIKPGYPDCTMGWKKMKEKDWNREEIPDLKKPFTKAQWLAYKVEYGVLVAQEFLDCCDLMKPTEAFQMENPPRGETFWYECEVWFEQTFRAPLRWFIDGGALGLGNAYCLDVLKFERHLSQKFGYPADGDGSMQDFITKTFGESAAVKIKGLLASE